MATKTKSISQKEVDIQMLIPVMLIINLRKHTKLQNGCKSYRCHREPPRYYRPSCKTIWSKSCLEICSIHMRSPHRRVSYSWATSLFTRTTNLTTVFKWNSTSLVIYCLGFSMKQDISISVLSFQDQCMNCCITTFLF